MLTEADNGVFVLSSPLRLIEINVRCVYPKEHIYIYIFIYLRHNLHCHMKDKVLARSHPLIPVPSIKCLHFFFFDVRELLTQRRHRCDLSGVGCVSAAYM